MTRTVMPLTLPDLSGFARSLRRSLLEHVAEHAGLPSHQSLLNHIARAAGHRNLQALQALQAHSPAAARAPTAAAAHARAADAPPLSAAATKALGSFDDWGRMLRWPHKYSVQRLALWVMWMQFESRRVYTEREVNAVLKAWHTWGDHVTLRRELINDRLLTRKSDGSSYRKLPVRPSDEARAVMAAWRARVSDASRRGPPDAPRQMDPSEEAARRSRRAVPSRPIPDRETRAQRARGPLTR
jgi:ribosomal protein L12E/L44/L45/RPP1/RPP2